MNITWNEVKGKSIIDRTSYTKELAADDPFTEISNSLVVPETPSPLTKRSMRMIENRLRNK